MAKVVKRKIVVEVGYYDFYFDDLIAANAFAVIAKSHMSEDRAIRVTADYDFEEEKDKEVEQDD